MPIGQFGKGTTILFPIYKIKTMNKKQPWVMLSTNPSKQECSEPSIQLLLTAAADAVTEEWAEKYKIHISSSHCSKHTEAALLDCSWRTRSPQSQTYCLQETNRMHVWQFSSYFPQGRALFKCSQCDIRHRRSKAYFRLKVKGRIYNNFQNFLTRSAFRLFL